MIRRDNQVPQIDLIERAGAHERSRRRRQGHSSVISNINQFYLHSLLYYPYKLSGFPFLQKGKNFKFS
jgi:hypothetical protein